MTRSRTGSTVSRCNGEGRPEKIAQLSQSSFLWGLRHEENWLWFPGQLVKVGNSVNGEAQNCQSVIGEQGHAPCPGASLIRSPTLEYAEGQMAIVGGKREHGAGACFVCPAPLSEHVRNTGRAIIQDYPPSLYA